MLGCDRGGQDPQLAPRPSPGEAAGGGGTTWAAWGRGMGQPHAPHNDTGGCQAREGPVPPAQPGDVPHAQAHRPLRVSPQETVANCWCATRGALCREPHVWGLATLLLFPIPGTGFWFSSWFSVPPAAPPPARPPPIFIQVQTFYPSRFLGPSNSVPTCLLLHQVPPPDRNTAKAWPKLSWRALPARLWPQNSALLHLIAALQNWHPWGPQPLAAQPGLPQIRGFRQLADLTNAPQPQLSPTHRQLLHFTGILSELRTGPQLLCLYKYFCRTGTSRSPPP